jgi:hypothetical protein
MKKIVLKGFILVCLLFVVYVFFSKESIIAKVGCGIAATTFTILLILPESKDENLNSDR